MEIYGNVNNNKSARSGARVFIVDDHPLIRFGMRHMFENESDLSVCGEAENILESLPLIKSAEPDIVIVDISLPDGCGLDMVKRIKAQLPHIAILVSSMHDEALFAERALLAGAMGYINKQEAPSHLVEAVRRVLKGKVYVSQRMTERLLQAHAGNVKRSSIETLSDRELEVFRQIGEGCGTAQIAANLHLSIKTIETYRAHIKQKLGIESASDLIRHAVLWSSDAHPVPPSV